MSATQGDREQYADWFSNSVKQARNGDREMAEGLIREFAQLANDPDVFDPVGGVPKPLIQHIAACLADWQKRKYTDAATWFFVDRPSHAPEKTTGQHVSAMRAYLLLRARGKGTEDARLGAANYSKLSDGQVRHLLAKDKAPQPDWFKDRAIGAVEAAALMCINKRLHKRVLDPPRKKYQRRV